MRAGTEAKARARTTPVSDPIHMGGQDTGARAERPRTDAAGARGRAHDRARYAHRQTKAAPLAGHFKVSASRVRHFGSDDPSGPITMVCEAVADPNVDGEAIAEVVEEALEDRYLAAAEDVLRARLTYLVSHAEHLAEARQNAALMHGGAGANDAVRDHEKILREIVAIRVRLGIEESVH